MFHEDNKHCRRNENLSRDSPKRCISPSSDTVPQAIDYPSPINASERGSFNSNEPHFWRRTSRSLPSRSLPSRSLPSRSLPSRSLPSRSRIRSHGVKSDSKYRRSRDGRYNYRIRSRSNSIDGTSQRTFRPYHRRDPEYHQGTPSRYVTISSRIMLIKLIMSIRETC